MAGAIGLDIGTFAVRAGEVEMTSAGVRLVRFGQLTLPPGAVSAGEILDVDVVAATLRRLWDLVGFGSRRVVLGITNPRVMVRQAEMPAMSDADLASALRFEAADLLPLEPDEARVDFQVLHELVNARGEARMQLLVAAAQRSMLDVHMEACRAARLRVARVDPMPLALVRAVGRPGIEVLSGHPTTEAIVCVGAGVTTIVVHEDGVPRFARIVAEGSGAATNAVAAELGVDMDTAEDLKRRAGTGDGADPRADLAVSRTTARLVDEIDNSIRFHMAQPGASRVERILLAGSGSRLDGLTNRLQATTGIPVERVRASDLVIVDAGMTEEEVARAEPNLPTVVGLALAALTPVEGRRINLLPAEVVQGRDVQLQIAAAGAAVALIAALLVVIWAFRGHQISSQRQTIADDQTRTAALQRQLAQLGPVAQLQTSLAQRQQQVRSALSGDIGWTQLLNEISGVLPNDVWLTSFSGTGGPGGVAHMTVQAKGLSQTSTAAWIQRISSLSAVTGLWVPNSTSGGSGAGVTFSSSANLTSAADSNRAGQYTGSP